MNNLNKKAVSGVIVTVLLVLLVFAAIAIVWAVVQPFITGTLDDATAQAECIKLVGSNEFTISTICLNVDPVDDNCDVGTAGPAEKPAIVLTRAKTTVDSISEVRFLVDGSAVTAENTDTIPKDIGDSVTYKISGMIFKPGQEVQIIPILDGFACDPISTGSITQSEPAP